MTSQIATRSRNYLSLTAGINRGFAQCSVTTRVQNGSFRPRRVRACDQIWRHRRKERPNPSPLCISSSLHESQSARQAHRSTAYVVCNHNLSSLDVNAHSDFSGLTPCGQCNILGTYNQRSWSGFSSSGHGFGEESILPASSLDSVRTIFSDDHDGDSEESESFVQKIGPFNAHFPRHLGTQFLTTSPLSSYRSSLLTAPNDANWIVLRTFHSSSRRLEESKSKVEDTVKALKEEAKAKQQPAQALAQEPPKTVAKKRSLWQRFVAELRHYYHGFKLLFIDVRLCSRYLINILRGKSLTRRERRQLVRTTADLFRLVPFLVFIIVPFMEFLLPVALKLFPGMLPSTFSEEKKEQEKLRKTLKGKLEMAKFLQDTIEEMSLQRKGSDESRVQEFKTFMKRVRSSGEEISTDEIIKYSKIFKDEITLDSLGHAHLVALCKLLELQPIGTNAFLRFQLRMKLRQLEADDRMIDNEGIDNLAVWELQEACRARGMRALGVATDRLKHQLQQWLDLHLEERVPASLLLLSRALYLAPTVPPEEQLKATISVLPETTAEGAKVAVSEVAGERIDNKAKLEVIKQEEQAIQEEREESAKEMAEDEEKKRKEEAAKEAAKQEVIKEEVAKEEGVQEATESVVDTAKDLGIKQEEILVDKATTPEFKEEIQEPTPEMKEKAAGEEEHISKKELEEVEEVLEQVAEEKMSMKLEQDELEALKEDVSEYKENLEVLNEVVLATGGEPTDVTESKGAQRLSKQVNKMVDQLEGLVQQLHADKDVLTEEIEVGEVRIKRSKELQEDDSMRQEMLDRISVNKANVVSINELLLSMKRLQKISDDTKVQRIMEVLDEDKDGIIDIDDALKVIELLGRENVKVSASKMSEILELLRKETAVEENIKREKKAKSSETTEVKRDGSEPMPEEILKDPADQPKGEQKN